LTGPISTSPDFPCNALQNNQHIDLIPISLAKTKRKWRSHETPFSSFSTLVATPGNSPLQPQT
jgi:hypothetical protein